MSQALTRLQLHVLNAVQGRIEDRKERGATMVEYGIMVAFIAAVCIVAVTLLGKQVNTAFTKITTALTGGGFGS